MIMTPWGGFSLLKEYENFLPHRQTPVIHNTFFPVNLLLVAGFILLTTEIHGEHGQFTDCLK